MAIKSTLDKDMIAHWVRCLRLSGDNLPESIRRQIFGCDSLEMGPDYDLRMDVRGTRDHFPVINEVLLDDYRLTYPQIADLIEWSYLS